MNKQQPNEIKEPEGPEGLYEYLGGDPAKVSREWRRLKLFVSRDPNLSALSYKELYERLFDQYSTKSNEQHY